jgi:hypothetical protein
MDPLWTSSTRFHAFSISERHQLETFSGPELRRFPFSDMGMWIPSSMAQLGSNFSGSLTSPSFQILPATLSHSGNSNAEEFGGIRVQHITVYAVQIIQSLPSSQIAMTNLFLRIFLRK